MFLFVRWEDVSLTISVRSIQDYSNHIRRGFCRSCIWETLSRSGCSGWRGEDETNPSVSRWITSQIDNKKYRQDLWRGKIVKYISFIWLFLYNYINIFFKWLLERRDGRLEYAPSTKSQERICHTFRGRMRRLLGNRLEWICPTGSLGLPWGSARLYAGGKPAYAESIERQTSGFLDAMTSSQIHGSRHSDTEPPPQPVAFLFSFVLYYKFKYFV